MNQKGFVNIAVIIGIVVLIVMTGYFILNEQTPLPTPISSPTSSPTPTPTPTSTQPSFSGQRQSFETVAKGGYSGRNDRKDYVIKEVSGWRNLWDIVHATVTPKPILPNINFNDEMIIAVFQGDHSTGGYTIEIVEILEKDDSLEILVKETTPSPGSIVTQVFTQPFHIIKTKGVDKEIVFRH